MRHRTRLDRLARRLPGKRRGGVVVVPLHRLDDPDAVAEALEGREGSFLVVPETLPVEEWEKIAVEQQRQLAERMRLL